MYLKQTQVVAVLAAAGCLSLASTVQANSESWEGGYGGIGLGFARPSVSNHWIAGKRTINGDPQDIPTASLNRGTSMYNLYAGANWGLPNWAKGRDWVMGLEGSYSPKQIRNTTHYKGNDNQQSHSEHAIFELNSTASIRARLGVIFDDTLVSVSAGMSVLDARFGAQTSDDDGDGDSGEFVDFDRLAPVIGLSIERGVMDNFSLRGDFSHYVLNDSKSTSCLGDGTCDDAVSPVVSSYAKLNHLTTAMLGVTYHF